LSGGPGKAGAHHHLLNSRLMMFLTGGAFILTGIRRLITILAINNLIYMPFEFFLKRSMGSERIHQFVLQSLLFDPLFVQILTGIQLNSKPEVLWEPVKGMFDLGIKSNGKILCLFELKMWSDLSDGQLDKQMDHLRKEKIPGFHILLGTSDLQFYRGADRDDIAIRTKKNSVKIGYAELVHSLETYISTAGHQQAIMKMASDYKSALVSQRNDLDNAWLDNSPHSKKHCYSLYNKIRSFLLKEGFKIHSVNNNGGASHVFNDQRSWFRLKYQGFDFEVYQEMLDDEYMVRIYNENAPAHIRSSLKKDFIKEFKKRAGSLQNWSYQGKASKYHKIAKFKPKVTTLAECENMAIFFKSMNPVIKEIAASIHQLGV
jgi:hypothetical protein